MKKTVLLLFTCFICSSSFAQLEKGNWLVGGSGSFSSAKYKGIPVDFTQTNVDISTTLGYFVLNKFVTGISGDYSYFKANYYGHPNFLTSSSNAYNFGPFLRYYILSNERWVNIFTQLDYNYGFDRGILYSKTFTCKAGPVIYISKSIGIEFSLGYSFIQNKNYSQNLDFFQTGLGLQIHLKK